MQIKMSHPNTTITMLRGDSF